jgi:hypothetical protein
MYRQTLTLVHGEQLYTDLLHHIRRDVDLTAAMWADAESRPGELDVPDTHWPVALTGAGTPAAWCAARIEHDGTLKCHSNYEVRQHRGHGLYEDAYHARHRDVILAYRRLAVTYLFHQPIALHEANGWHRTGLTNHGPTGNQWWELRRPERR